ncbi:hypothetical protein [Pseudoalteromonas sp. OOF1S-7]|uniref:hypothetical protein n=1 Tax=Pseudoalteromonas sp. OOF1S-7 TaxID=2917757 RepID=UPI001EF59A7C|nr:hypothetical protein [Pseudoalteromonas sp. OOF1S-7]MCG7534115.1 hypothetical protein [Pseudoalteromonas sp. OOF1S-7]
MIIELSAKTKHILKIHSKSFNEVFWMTVAALSPVFLAWLYLTLNENKVPFSKVVLEIFLGGPIFAYVAALLAPFLFLLKNYFSNKNKDTLSFGGVSLVLAILVTIISVFLFSDKQESLFDEASTSEINSLVVKMIPETKLYKYEVQAKAKIEKEKKDDQNFTFRDILALICYVLALILFYYSVYIKYKEAPDLDQDARDRNTSLQQAIDKEFGGK